jgi:hypothetical protein
MEEWRCWSQGLNSRECISSVVSEPSVHEQVFQEHECLSHIIVSKREKETFKESSILSPSEPLLEKGLDRHGGVEPDLHPIIDSEFS